MVVPVLELGGTHVTGALVQGGLVVRGPVRTDFARDPDREDFVTTIGSAVQQLGLGVSHNGWGMALPGPFDYARGVGDFTGVGKFLLLGGVDIRSLLHDRLGIDIAVFLNDADAFGLGEAFSGAGVGLDPGLYLTLGTGVGSAWIRGGHCVHEGSEVPPDGHAYRIVVDGKPLEEAMSRRALIARWREAGREGDVSQMAAAARLGETTAQEAFAVAYDALARGLSPYLRAFSARVIVVGGSIATSFDLIERYLVPALRAHGVLAPVRRAAHPQTSALVGAAQATLWRPPLPGEIREGLL